MSEQVSRDVIIATALRIIYDLNMWDAAYGTDDAGTRFVCGYVQGVTELVRALLEEADDERECGQAAG